MNLASKIRHDLQTEIEEGTLPPGTAFDERAIAERFNVSRTPVREAVQQLAALDLVRIEPRVGIFVSKLSVRKLRALLELLGELEGICAKLAARRADAAACELISETLARCEEAAGHGELAAYSEANRQFHDAIYQASRNEYLVEQVRLIRRMTQRYRINDLRSSRQIERSMAGHREIAAAVINGDDVAAHLAMLRHIPIGNEGFSEFLSTLPAEFFDAAEKESAA